MDNIRSNYQSATPIPSVEDVTVRFLRTLEEREIDYCLLGDARDFPNTTRDVDVAVNRASLARVCELLAGVWCSFPIRLVQSVRHEACAVRFVLSWRGTGSRLYFHPDVCSDYLIEGRPVLTAEEMLSGRQYISTGQGFFYVPATHMGFAYYLSKRIFKEQIGPREGSYLSTLWWDAPGPCRDQIARFWPGDAGRCIETAAQSDDWKELALQLPELKRLFLRRAPRRLVTIAREAARCLKRIAYPTGVSLVFLGLDDKGRSTVARRVAAEIAPAFPGGVSFAFFGVGGKGSVVARHIAARLALVFFREMKVLRVLPRSPMEYEMLLGDPHVWPSHDTATSSLKAFYFPFSYLTMRLLKIRPMLVIFDRCCHDLLVDPRCYRYRGSMWIFRAVAWLIPKPDLCVLMDAPTEVVRSRKPEIPLHAICRQRAADRVLVGKMPNGIVVDADQALDDLSAEVVDRILTRMSDRLVRRSRW